MKNEDIGLLLSLAGLLLIPCAIVISIAAIRRVLFKATWPAGSEMLKTCGISIGITLAITLVICFVFQWTGFFDAQFYRPSSRDYGRAAELGLEPEEVSFASSDGTSLHGWVLPVADAVGTVVVFHGSDRNITHTVANTHWLLQHGLNVFVFDYRGYGRSAGRPSRQGLVEDSVAAIDYVTSRNDVDSSRIVLYGQSMGGQLALNAASLKKDLGIRLVVAEATYAKHSYHIADKLGRLGPLWLVKWGAWLLTSDEYCGEDAIHELGVPVLLIHGSADAGVSPYHSERLHNAASDPKEIWRYDGHGHLQIFKTEEDQVRLGDYIKAKLGSE